MYIGSFLPSCSTDLDPDPDGADAGAAGIRAQTPVTPDQAGFPSPAADYVEEGLDLNAYLVRNQPATFMFTVKGDSMINAGIQEGDKVIVDRALNPKHDDIVVAVVDGDYTIKRLYKHMGRIELRSENPAYPPILFQDGTELLIVCRPVKSRRAAGDTTGDDDPEKKKP